MPRLSMFFHNDVGCDQQDGSISDKEKKGVLEHKRIQHI